jgi:hypothetical protein
MAVYFKTNDSRQLLASFKKAIDDGAVVTWSYDKDGDFTHTVEQWKNLAWFRPQLQNDRLAFYIIKPRTKTISTLIYAIYHGRFIESMLAHCDSLFSEADSTAFPSEKDLVS